MIKDNEEFFSSEVRGVEMRQRPARGMDRSAMSQGSDARPERPMREERDMRDLRSGGRSSSERPRNLRARKADKRRELIYIIILAVEVIALAAIIIVYANIKGKMGDSGKNKSQAGEESSGSSSGGSVNVDNDNFKLTCTKVSITTDSNGNPAALIYFTFVNKTSTPLSMTEVYAPMVSQNGIACETFTTFAERRTKYITRTYRSRTDSPLSALIR